MVEERESGTYESRNLDLNASFEPLSVPPPDPSSDNTSESCKRVGKVPKRFKRVNIRSTVRTSDADPFFLTCICRIKTWPKTGKMTLFG